MQFTFKFILIALALACGGTAVSAAPLAVTKESFESVAARSVDASDDVELFVRDDTAIDPLKAMKDLLAESRVSPQLLRN